MPWEQHPLCLFFPLWRVQQDWGAGLQPSSRLGGCLVPTVRSGYRDRDTGCEVSATCLDCPRALRLAWLCSSCLLERVPCD